MSSNVDDLRHIRSMMERFTKFLSLSGKSGILAGVSALIGAGAVYQMVYQHAFCFSSDVRLDVFLIAMLVLGVSGDGGLYFSWQKAKKMNQIFWSNATKQLFVNGGVSLFIGGIFCLILVYNNIFYLLASTMLIFCGIACINAGDKTYRDIKILGTGLVLLSICAGFWTDYGLLFWSIGFGVLFIIYGIVLYRKYDVVAPKN